MRRLTTMILIACLLLWGLGPIAVAQSAPPELPDAVTPGPRVIELEVVGVQRYLQDGAKVRDIAVVAGEDLLFRVDNTTGMDLDFSIGSFEQICDLGQTAAIAIPGWTTGVRELRWTVPDRFRRLRFGASSDRRCRLGTFSNGTALPEGGVEKVAEPSVAPAIGKGRPRAYIAQSDGFIVFDAAYEGSTTAITWRSFGDPWETLDVVRFDDVKLKSFSSRAVADDVSDHAVAICGDVVLVAFVQHELGEERRLQLARVPRDQGPITSVTLQAAFPKRGAIDVACARGRAIVAWTQRVGSEWHAFVRDVRLADLEPSRARDIGRARRDPIAVAADGSLAYVSWSGLSGIRLNRYDIDVGLDRAVSTLGSRVVATQGRRPILAADGNRVALGFDQNEVATVMISRDAGATFSERGRFDSATVKGAAPRELSSLALEGKQVVATLAVFYGGDAWDWHRLRSMDLGKTWALARIGNPLAAIPIDGFLVTPDGVKVVEAITDGVYAQDWDLRVRRER